MDQAFLLEINKVWREELTPADIAEREAQQAEFKKWMFFEDKEKVKKVKKEEEEWMKEDDAPDEDAKDPPRKLQVARLGPSSGSDASERPLIVFNSSIATATGNSKENENAKADFRRVTGAIYARGGYVQYLPGPLDTFNSIADKPGVAFFFKPSGIDQLYRLFQYHRPILLRRPFGWGIEMFATSFIARIDKDQTIDFAALHAPESTSDSVCGVRQHSVLALDFHDLDTDARTVTDLAHYMHQKCNAFLEYEGLRELPSRDSFVGGSVPACEIFTCVVVR
ncbi:hypothetical protein MKEN_00757500 [Mycena kentingensis (nom. inval.)]|nr:hypothetical protein MKEN_00757500 [Mycena kentingensis (nom. inval.)]